MSVRPGRHRTLNSRMVIESVLMSDVEAAKARLAELNDLGALIALDDFGTGYSSLAYLRQYTAQRDELERLGCELGQGYLLCRPMGADDLVAALRGRASPARSLGAAGRAAIRYQVRSASPRSSAG